MRSTDQLGRLLELIPFLQAHPGIAVGDAAREFGLTQRQLVAELNLLFLCGLPGGLPDDLIDIDMDAVADEGAIYLTNADYLTRPMSLQTSEAASLVVALAAASGLATGEVAGAISSARAKLEKLMADEAPVVAAAEPVDAGIRAVVEDAIAEGRQLQLTYRGDTRGRTSEPIVDPAGLTQADGRTYLEAWSLDRDAWRTFRLDRVADARPTGQPTSDHGQVPEREAWFPDAVDELRVRIAPGSEWLVEYYPSTAVEQTPDGLEVSFPVANPAWATSFVMRHSGRLSVIEPSSVRHEAAARARAALNRYQHVPCADEVSG